MSNHEQCARSPMASRRVRRHAMGVSNAHSVDDTTSSVSRSTVSLVHADRLVKVPQHLRSPDPAARETRVEDRPLVTRLHDKLFKTHRERHVRKVLRSVSGPDGRGLLGPAQLRTALELLHVGLEREERERIIARVAPDEDSKVHYLDFLRVYDILQPLGDEQVAVARGMSVPGPPVVRPGGGGAGGGDGGRSYWDWQRHRSTRLPGLLDEVREGTAEQVHSDQLLTALLVAKLGNCRDKLRQVFRDMDQDRNSVLDREEFARGIAKLRIDVSRAQVDRLFDICDADRDGVVDYTEFIRRFEEPGMRDSRPFKDTATAGAMATLSSDSTLAATSTTNGAAASAVSLELSPDEVQGALRHPLVLELARSLYGKGSQAAAPFKQLDLPRNGRLDVRDMTAACRALVPGIGERQVAAVMAAVEPGASSLVDYRAFIARVEGGLVHPRLAHSAPPGGKAAAAAAAAGSGASADGRGALARFGETLTAPEALPTPHTRALSAVSLSRRADDGGSSGGGSRVADPPLPPSSTHPDRDQLFKIHNIAISPVLRSINAAAAAAGEPPVPSASRSVDLPGGGSGLSAGERDSKAPSHSTGRFSRFWSRRFADTSTITTADPASALRPAASGPFVRKTTDFSRDFLHYQAEDRAKEARRREQYRQRFAAHADIDARYSANDDASGADDGRLAVARATRQRYEERCEMYDRIRHMKIPSDHTFFAKLPVFGEHKSDTANQAVWSDQTRAYY